MSQKILERTVAQLEQEFKLEQKFQLEKDCQLEQKFQLEEDCQLEEDFQPKDLETTTVQIKNEFQEIEFVSCN